MKNLIIVLVLLSVAGLSFGQHKRKSITDTIFQLEQANVEAKTKKVELMGMDVPIRFVPITVTQLSSQTLERKGITEMSDAIKFMPGITESRAQYGQFQQFSIRGQGSAVIMIDGIRDERTVGNNVPYGDLSSVETIELLKGPASVLAGHSAMGGVLNIVRKKTTSAFSANARLSYGSWNDKRATLGFGGKLAGPVDYRFNLHYATGDGFRNVYADRFSGFAAIGANIGKKGRLDVTAGFADDDYRTDIGGAPVMPGDVFRVSDNSLYANKGERHPEADYRTNYNDYANNYMHRRQWDMSVQYTHILSDRMKLRERFTYSHSDLNYHCIERVDYLTSAEPVYDWYYLNKDKKVYINMDTLRRGDWKSLNPLNFNPDHQNTNNVLELTGELATGPVRHRYTLGWALSFFDMKQYNGYTVEGDDVDLWGPGLDVLLPVRNPQTVQGWWDTKVSAASLRTELTNGIYLLDVLELSDAWKVMLAGRMEFFRQDRASATVDGKQEYKPENRTSDWVTKKQKAFTYRAGFVYQPLSKFSVYASMASFYTPITRYSYNSKVMYLDRDGKEFNPDEESMFDPEKGWSAEAGIRYTLDRKVELNASVFYIRKLNMVKTLGDTTLNENGAAVTKSIYAQVGTADSRGFDLEVILRPVSTLQVTGGFSFADYRVREVRKSKKLGYSDAGKNLRATWAPRTTYYAYVDYTIPKGVLKDLSFHLSGNFRDKLFTDVKTHTYIPSLWLMDAGVYYTVKKHVTLSLNVNNILNKEYFTTMTVPGKPRNFQAALSYHF